MKELLTILLTILMPLQAYSQNNLSGKVTDKETNEPLSGAHIYISDCQKRTITNTKGLFEIKDLPQGDFLVEVGSLGYSTTTIRTDINGDTQLNVGLTPSIIEMNEVVVTGTSVSTEKRLNPVPITTISNVALNQRPSSNIIDAIARQPGISQITTGAAISKPVIRGLGYNRVVVLNNNIRQEGQQWGDEHGIEIDEYSVDRVEIIKGPGSLMYGSDAMAGVINFLAPKPVEKGKIIGRLLANYQSNNYMQGYSAMNAGNIKNINWLARISSKTAGNYSNSIDGKVYNSGFNELSYNAMVGIGKKWGYSQLHFSSFNQTLGLIEGDRDSLGNFMKMITVNDTVAEEQSVSANDLLGYSINIPRQRINHLIISSESKLFFRKSILSLNFAFQQNSRKEFTNPLNSQATDLFFLLNTFNYDVKYVLGQTNGWQTSIGVNGMQQSNYNKGEEFLIPEYNLFDAGVFAFTQKSFNNLHISGGFRYDIRSLNILPLYLDADNKPTNSHGPAVTVKFKEFSTIFANYSASIGASYSLTDKLTAKSNITKGFRSPNISELGSNGLHEGTFRYELGNTNLNPETSVQVDAGLLYNSGHVSVELSIFNNSIQNYIHLQKLDSYYGGDSIIGPSNPVAAFQFVQGDANLYGGEFVIDVHPHPLDWLHFENAFSFVRGQQFNHPDSTKYLPFMPPPKFQSELRAEFNKIGSILSSFHISVGLAYTFQQTEVLSAFGTETPTPGYSLVNAEIGANITNSQGNTVLSFSLAANNILNVAYQSHLSRLKYAPANPANNKIGVFNMGRNIRARLAVPLTIKKES